MVKGLLKPMDSWKKINGNKCYREIDDDEGLYEVINIVDGDFHRVEIYKSTNYIHQNNSGEIIEKEDFETREEAVDYARDYMEETK